MESASPLHKLGLNNLLLFYFNPLVGTEELGHLEMVGTLVHQLTRNLNKEQIKTAGFDTYFVDHTTGVYPQFASGYPWSASTMQVTGDIIADLTEDLAADGAMVEGQHEKQGLSDITRSALVFYFAQFLHRQKRLSWALREILFRKNLLCVCHRFLNFISVDRVKFIFTFCLLDQLYLTHTV